MLTNRVPGPNNCSSTDGRMPDERWWYWFVYASLGTYFSALLLALANYAVKGENRHLYICRGRGDGNVKSGTFHPLFCYLWIILIIPRCFPASCCFSIQRLSVRGSSDGRGFGLILVTVIITGNTLTAPSRSIQPQTTT